jgi:hypothetical protein
VNDNKPVFEKLMYTTNVLESAKYGDVFKVRAVDADAPNTANSKVIYTIESGAMDKFSIDANTGLVKLVDNVDLDRDVYGLSYTLKIVATNYNSFINISRDFSSSTTVAAANRMDTESWASAAQDLHEIFGSINNESFVRTNYCFLKVQVVDVNNKKPYFLRNNE